MVMDRSYICRVDGCNVDLKYGDSRYYKRHKICVSHAMSPLILVDNVEKRFCQQCSRLHDVSLFDGIKKSCRESLAGHNERRRKTYAQKFEVVRPVVVCNVHNNGLTFSTDTNFHDLNQVVSYNPKPFRCPYLNPNPYYCSPSISSSIFSPLAMLPPPSLAETTLQMFHGTKHFPIIL